MTKSNVELARRVERIARRIMDARACPSVRLPARHKVEARDLAVELFGIAGALNDGPGQFPTDPLLYLEATHVPPGS